MQDNREKCRELAARIYELDGEVYRCVGSSLGRTFTGNKETTIKSLAAMMYTRPQGHLLRSELALINNMARTIPDVKDRHRLLDEYALILKEISELPDSFGSVDIIDEERAKLNISNLHQKFSKDDRLIVCIGRSQGSAGNDIGFELAKALKINYYDAEIFTQVLERLEAEKDSVNDAMQHIDKYNSKRSWNLKKMFQEFNRYHGLPTQDAIFFNQSDLICSMAKKEDFVIMGRCADVILKNNHIPHISIFIDAPFELRVQRIMAVNNMKFKEAVHFLKKMDKRHARYYNFYTSEQWGKAVNYDLCINSASYGLEETVELIERMIAQKPKHKH